MVSRLPLGKRERELNMRRVAIALTAAILLLGTPGARAQDEAGRDAPPKPQLGFAQLLDPDAPLGTDSIADQREIDEKPPARDRTSPRGSCRGPSAITNAAFGDDSSDVDSAGGRDVRLPLR